MCFGHALQGLHAWILTHEAGVRASDPCGRPSEKLSLPFQVKSCSVTSSAVAVLLAIAVGEAAYFDLAGGSRSRPMLCGRRLGNWAARGTGRSFDRHTATLRWEQDSMTVALAMTYRRCNCPLKMCAGPCAPGQRVLATNTLLAHCTMSLPANRLTRQHAHIQFCSTTR